jgi:hypothetical protein
MKPNRNVVVAREPVKEKHYIQMTMVQILVRGLQMSLPDFSVQYKKTVFHLSITSVHVFSIQTKMLLHCLTDYRYSVHIYVHMCVCVCDYINIWSSG